MSERERRVAHNETVFRSANEQLRATREQLEFEPGVETPFICECGDARCTKVMPLSLTEYERVRDDPDTFAVIPGHNDAETETVVTGVVERTDRFAVVRKRKEVRAEPEETDPRR